VTARRAMLLVSTCPVSASRVISAHQTSLNLPPFTPLTLLTTTLMKVHGQIPDLNSSQNSSNFDLSYSGLSGALPVENGQLSSLVALNLSGLDLKDLNLKTLIDSLGSLQELYLENVNISASPSNLAHASSTNTTSSLKELTMGWCTITGGRFDTDLANLLFRSNHGNLVKLYLSDFDLKNLSLHILKRI